MRRYGKGPCSKVCSGAGAQIDAEQVRELHARIGEQALPTLFWKAEALRREVMRHSNAIGPSGHATSRVSGHALRPDRQAASIRWAHLDGRLFPRRHLHREAMAHPEPKVRAAKDECVSLHAWEAGSETAAAIRKWMAFHNHQRPHSALDGRPPAMLY